MDRRKVERQYQLDAHDCWSVKKSGLDRASRWNAYRGGYGSDLPNAKEERDKHDIAGQHQEDETSYSNAFVTLCFLKHLEPTIFVNEDAWIDEDQVGILSRALGCNRNCDLPNKHYEGITDVPSLKKAMAIQYNLHGKIYAGLQPELVKKGLFEVDAHVIICVSPGAGPKRVDLGEDAEDITLLDAYDPMTTVRMTVDGMDMIVDDLASSFEQQGLVFGDPLATWELSPHFVPKEAKVPKKRERSAASTLEGPPCGSSSGASSQASSSMAVESPSKKCPLSSVLQRRINEKRK